MMLTGYNTQDTLKPKLIIRINTDNLLPDSVFRKLDEVPAHIRSADSVTSGKRIREPLPEFIVTDSTSVSSRNSIGDFTFYDSNSLFSNPLIYPQGQFPFMLLGKQTEVHQKQAVIIAEPLMEGIRMPENPLRHDWITAFMFLAALLWLVVKITTRKIFPELTRFFLFRGINESSSRDTPSLFYWQSTVLNFVSFLVLALFAYSAIAYHGLIPQGTAPFLIMMASLVFVIAAVTMRHFLCLAAGNLSGQTEIFNEYLMTVYQSYRFSAVPLFVLIVILSYTAILPQGLCFVAGVVFLSLLYFYRVTRLMLIFLKRNVSVLYLILYLCALEIGPSVVFFKILSRSM